MLVDLNLLDFLKQHADFLELNRKKTICPIILI